MDFSHGWGGLKRQGKDFGFSGRYMESTNGLNLRDDEEILEGRHDAPWSYIVIPQYSELFDMLDHAAA